MDMNFTIPNDFLTKEEIEKLGELFGLDSKNENYETEFRKAISSIVIASLSEYRDMFLGLNMPSRADEIREHRLFLLIKYFFKSKLPTEADVSSMFQLTQTRSKSLIRNVMTRFRYQLKGVINNTLLETLESANFDKQTDEYRLIIQADNIVEELNLIIAKVAPQLDPVKKIPNRSRNYSISVDSFNALKEHLE